MLALCERNGSYTRTLGTSKKTNKLINMKNLLFSLLIVMTFCSVKAQNISKADTVLPKFRGSSNIADLREYLQKEFIYPPIAVENGEQGTVIVKFQVTREAMIDSIEILNNVSQAIDYESVRCLMKTKSQWTAGLVNNIKTSFNIIVPIKLMTESGKGEEYFINKGNKFLSKLDYTSALNSFTEAVKLNPFNIEIVKKKIECEEKLKMLSDLERDMKLLDYVINY
jgi:hypothetical protein